MNEIYRKLVSVCSKLVLVREAEAEYARKQSLLLLALPFLDAALPQRDGFSNNAVERASPREIECAKFLDASHS